MREFRIKVNNEKTYVVKANDYNQAVKTLHSKLNDDWSKGVSVTVKVTTESLINAAKEHKVLLGGRNDAPEKFIGRTSIRFTLPNKDNTAYANIDNSQSTIHYNMYDDEFTYKEFGGKKDFNKAKLTEGLKKLQDYVVSQLISAGIVVNQSKVEVGGSSKFNSTWRQAQSYNDSSVKDYDLTNFLALKRSLELRIGEEIDFDKLEEYVNKLPKDKNGKKNINVKEVIKCCIKAKDNAVSDSISRYTGEDAIRTNGFVKIKEDGDWTSYKYNGSDFDSAVFKIHQYNPSLIAFVSNGNRTITVRNKYLNDADNTAQGEIEVLKSFGFNYKDGRWVKESNNNNIIVQPDYHYVSVIGPGDTEKHCKKYQYQSAGMLKKIIASNIKDSSITDADMKIAEDIIKKYGGNPVGNVMGLQKTRFVGQDEIKNQHDFATDLDKAGYKFYLINGRYRISPKDSSIKDFGNFKTFAEVEKYLNSKGYTIDSADKPLPGQRLREKYITVYKNGKQKYIELFQYMNGDYEIMTSLSDSSIKDDLTMVEKYKKSIIYIDDNGYYYHTPIGGRGAKAQRDNTKDINIVKKRIDNDYSFLYDSSIKDVSYVSGKNLKIGQKIVEDGEVLEVVDIKETQRGVNNNYRDVTFKNVKTGATETVHFGNSTLARLNDYSIKDTKFLVHAYNDGKLLEEKLVNTKVEAEQLAKEFTKKYGEDTTSIKLVYSNISDKLIESGSKKALSKNIATEIKAGKDPKQAAAIAYSVQRENDSSIKDVDWDFANKLKQHSQEEIRNALKYSAPTVYKQYRNGETIQFAGLAGQLTGPEKTKVLKRLGDSNILSGYKYRITNNGSKWYYETTFPDGHTTLTGPYSSKQETEQYFHKHRPTEKLTDADPVKVEKIIRKEKSALGITYYIFQTKSSSGYTIYYQVTDKTYHGEPTYSGGGIISFSLKSANDTLDHNLLSDKLIAKYGEKEGTKRYLRGENDSAIKDKLSTSDANSLVEAYIDKYKYTHSNLPYVNKPKIKIFNSLEEFRDKFLSSYRGYSIYAGGLLNYNGYVVKLFTSAKDGKIESPSADNIFTIFPTTSMKDSNNIKNRKSYTIKVGDKQYKVFAESESEAINKYLKSKKQ